MNKIELRVESFQGVTPDRAWACIFGVAGGTIGRAGQNKFILSDDGGERVARVHAMVRLDSEHAYVSNLSERHSIVVEGQHVAAGVELRLSAGMGLGVGPYLLRAYAVNDDSAAAPRVHTGSATATVNPWAEVAVDAPLASLVTPPPPTPPTPTPTYKALLIPENFDIMAAPALKAKESELQSLAQVANIKSDGLLQSLPATDVSPQAMDNPAHRGLPKAFDTKQVVDPLALFGGAGVVDLLDMGMPLPLQRSDLAQSFSLPQQVAVMPAPVSSVAPSVMSTVAPTFQPTEASQPLMAPQGQHDMQALAQAFLQGAKVSRDNLSVQVTPEFMRTFGAAFQVAVQGTIDLLAIRSEIKREFRADVTIISSGANNPLKFLPTAEGVIMQLAGQPLPGFMKPEAAMHEAYQDLRVHQLALMAGIRAAYSEALARFDPTEIEKTVESGFLGKISSSAHKAALWDTYSKRYAQTRRMAEDDLTAFSGQTFLSAYEAAAADWKQGQT